MDDMPEPELWKYFVDVQLWPKRAKFDPQGWMRNFSGPEIPLAKRLLKGFTYYSSELVEQMFKCAFMNVSQKVVTTRTNFAEAQAEWAAFIASVTVVRVTGETPSDADSGFIFTRLTRDIITYSATNEFTPSPQSVYFYGLSPEARSGHVAAWKTRATDVSTYEITDETPDSFRIAASDSIYFLRGSLSLRRIFSELPKGIVVYLDITGLSHSVWAALLQAALLAEANLRVVYVEPNAYSRSAAPVDGQIYDLSLRITGIAPLPGFAVLSTSSSSDFVFVPLLGFEGTRFRHILEQVQPAAGKVIPVIGSPGFKPWYVYETYAGNRAALLEESSWQAVRYAPANCPFSCYFLLNEIAEASPNSAIKVALIGTKPHALGAVLFSLTHSAGTELIYDHPIPRQDRTSGSSRLLVYHVACLVANQVQQIAARRTVSRRRVPND